jgi:hypothetical protein
VKPISSTKHRRALALAGLLCALAASLFALALPTTAMASPCGDKVLDDWFDNGRIDKLYDPHCYEDAVDAIPQDLEDYTNAEEVIMRALQLSLRGELDPVGGPDPTPDDRDPGQPDGSPDDPVDPNDPDSEAAPDVDTTGISSIPLPLIALGLMSLVLLAAGGLGYLRRRHTGDGPPGPDDDIPV